MIHVKATLIKNQEGKCLLATDFGKFHVMDKPHYPSGKHHGFFEIKKINPSLEESNGAMNIIMQADIGDVYFNTITQMDLPTQETIRETAKSNIQAKVTTIDDCQPALEKMKVENEDLGLPNPLPDKYRVDSTLSRDLIQKQVEALRQAGFILGKDQVWVSAKLKEDKAYVHSSCL